MAVSSSFADSTTTYAKLFTQLKDYHDKATEFTIAVTDSEVTKISKASCNAELYIVDIVYHSIIAGAGGTPGFSFVPLNYKLYYDFKLLEFMHIVRKAVSSCDELFSYTWKDGLLTVLGGTPEVCYKIGQALKCNDAQAAATTAQTTYKAELDTHDRIILHSADLITNFALLCRLSTDYWLKSYFTSAQFTGKVKETMGFAHTLYQDNNIPIRVYSAIAFKELPGTKTTLSTLNPMLDSKFTPTGGYGEGTAYLKDVYEDLVPLYYFGLKQEKLSRSTDIKQSVLNSGKWLLSISDAASGSIPAVDDAFEITPWLAPFCYLNNDTKFLDYTNKFITPVLGYAMPTDPEYFPAGVARRFLTYPAQMNTPTPTPIANPDVSFNDGVVKMHFKEGSVDVNVCVTAESGQVLTSGNSHDQQDNGSITVNRATSPAQIDRLVIDPGYAGFSHRWETSKYELHNTVLINGSGVNSNPQWTDADIKAMVKSALQISSQTVLDNVYDKVKTGLMGSSGPALDKSAGTAAVLSRTSYSNGYLICQSFDVESTVGTKDRNMRRVIMYDGEILVADNIYSKKNNYGVHWNLPSDFTWNLSSQNIVTANAGNSQIRLSMFSQDPSMIVLEPKKISYASEISAGVIVASVAASNSGSGILYSKDCFNYLSVIETKNTGGLTGLQAYSYFTGTTAAVCITKNIPSTGITRYIFVNNILNGVKSTVTINGVSTNAAAGIIDFKTGTTTLDNVVVHDFSTLSNNGTVLSPTAVEFRLKTTLSKQAINANTIITSTNGVNISDVIVNPPAVLNVTGGKSVVILPETQIKNGSTAVVKVTP